MEEATRFKTIAELAELREEAQRARDVAQRLIDDYRLLLAWRRAIFYPAGARRGKSG